MLILAMAFGVAAHHAFTLERFYIGFGCLVAAAVICSAASLLAFSAAKNDSRLWPKVSAGVMHVFAAWFYVDSARSDFAPAGMRLAHIGVGAVFAIWAVWLILLHPRITQSQPPDTNIRRIKITVRIVVIAYLLYCCLGNVFTYSLHLLFASALSRDPLFPVIVSFLMVASAIGLSISLRVGALITSCTLLLLSFAMLTPIARYYISMGPGAGISLRVSADGWHVSPWMVDTKGVQWVLGFQRPTLQYSAFGINFVPLAFAIAALWAAWAPNGKATQTSVDNSADALQSGAGAKT